MPYKQYGIMPDTFTKTMSEQLSFKAADKNIYQKILNDPTLAEKFMGLIAAGAAALITAAGLENTDDKQNTNSGGNIFASLFSGLFAQSRNNVQNEELNKYIEENERLKKENEDIKTKLEQEKANQQKQTEIAESDEVTAGNGVNFPKKRGRLSKNQQELKSVTEQLNLTSVDQEKLLQICQELLMKNCHIIDGKKTENDEIAKEFATELLNSKDDAEKIEKIINKYFNMCIIPSESENIANNDTVNTAELLLKNSTTMYGVQNLRGAKVIGKIDLPEKTALPKKKEIPAELIIRDSDGNIKSVFFKKAGTSSEYSAEQLDEMLRFFIKTIYNDYKERVKQTPDLEKPRWLYNIPVPKSIRKPDIEREVKKQVIREKDYKYIKEKHFKELVNVINEDPRYNDLFDIHSALRLIDRFVNVNSDSEGIDVQSNRVLNKLFELIEQAYKNGTYINTYTDKETGLTGAFITLKAENFDSEAIDIFGPTDIIIGISERQNTKTYRGVENNKKEAIISTIYSKDV